MSYADTSHNQSYSQETLHRLQCLERQVLESIARICDAHNLTYFADGGTCLGAVRHGGFIPWDDDIDIGMPINDYLTFLKIAPRELPDGLSIHTCLDTPGFSALWAKVFIDGTIFNDSNAQAAGTQQGIFVDIFPYFPLDSHKVIAKRQITLCNFWQKVSYVKAFTNPKLPPIAIPQAILKAGLNTAHALLRNIPQKYIYKQFFIAAKAQTPSDHWFSGAYSTVGVYPTETLFPPREARFDDLMIALPANSDQYLRIHYGNYMEIPPEEERHTHLPEVLDFGDGINVITSNEHNDEII